MGEMKIKSQRKRHTNTIYQYIFEFVDQKGGFSFDCDEEGNILLDKNSFSCETYQQCISGEITIVGEVKKIMPLGIEEYTKSWFEPAIGECNVCGKDVSLSGFTNTCECGLDYNMSGQQLAPRDQWGEETGEIYYDLRRWY